MLYTQLCGLPCEYTSRFIGIAHSYLGSTTKVSKRISVVSHELFAWVICLKLTSSPIFNKHEAKYWCFSFVDYILFDTSWWSRKGSHIQRIVSWFYNETFTRLLLLVFVRWHNASFPFGKVTKGSSLQYFWGSLTRITTLGLLEVTWLLLAKMILNASTYVKQCLTCQVLTSFTKCCCSLLSCDHLKRGGYISLEQSGRHWQKVTGHLS